MKQIGTKTMQYVAKDHLGSVMALYDDTRTLIEEFSYDAWGRRRNPTNWTYISVPTATNTRHGFTGHEHLDKYALINMNGRVYDPVTGRFLSPDPYIQNPYNGQNFDRYAYCLNNPLKYVDPSGYKIDWPWNWGRKYWSSHDHVKRDNQVDPAWWSWGEWDDPFTSDAPWAFGTSGGGGGGTPIGGSAASGPGTGGGGGGGTISDCGDVPDGFVKLIDFTKLQRLIKGNSDVRPILFGIKKFRWDKQTTYWEVIEDNDNAQGNYNYISQADYKISIQYHFPFWGTVGYYSKNGNFSPLAHHVYNNIAFDYKNFPVNRYISSGPSGDVYQFLFPANMVYDIVIKEERTKTKHYMIPFFWFQIW